jgi:hypothetical protein
VPWAGGALALAVAAALFTRFGVDDGMRRDEAVYAYGGQQLADGVPPYVSIFDPKTPLATFLAGAGELLARALHADGVHTMRILFLVSACLAVGAVYVLARWLWESALAGLVAAVVLASFEGFAVDALGGPDAKTPGIFLGVLAMALLVRRRWFWGAFAGSLAFLAWQPLGVYPMAAVACAALAGSRRERLRNTGRAVAGAVVPVAVTALWFWLQGALGAFVEAAFTFPLVGITRGPETLATRLDRILTTVDGDYGRTRILFWAGIVAAFALLAVRLRRAGPRDDPYAVVVVATLLALIGFSLTDFQGYPDLYPLLPYAAVGLGGATALAVRAAGRLRIGAAAVAAGAGAALVIASWSWYSGDDAGRPSLVEERAHAAAIAAVAGSRGRVYAVGDPTVLVLTSRRNPSRYIYLGSGVEEWMLARTPGGFAGWKRRLASNPGPVALGGWVATDEERLSAWLHSVRQARRIGRYELFLPPA